MSVRIERGITGTAGRLFDVAVVGGGIHGALAAVESAHRGLATLLVEAGDFGGGASFNSLRTVHGGLRYLQSLDFARARQSARQQRWWFDRFPDLVRQRPCLMPLYGRVVRSRTAFRIANVLARVAGLPKISAAGAPAVEILEAREVVRRWPGIPERGLQGGALWREGFAPDSSRLVIECLRWAVAAGAVALNYVELVAAHSERPGRTRLDMVDRVTGESFQVAASAIVNAAGSRVEEVACRLSGRPRKLLVPTIAWNLLLDARLPEETCLALTPVGAQSYFLQPFHRGVLAGTGHAAAAPGHAASLPSQASIEAMRRDIDRAYPGAQFGRAHILRVLSGILPGVQSGSPRLAVRPRIDIDMPESGARTAHVIGVKFTEAPQVARRALDRLTGTAGGRLGSRPAGASRWDAFDSSAPITRESLHKLVADESVLCLDDLVERRTNAWCDEEARVTIERLADGLVARRAPPPGGLPPGSMRQGSSE
jgi:glycerol-3-phosphate dehydrogenase